MKKFALILMFALATLPRMEAVEIVDGVAAVVNDRVITYSEVKAFVQPVVQQLRRNYTGQELVSRVRLAQVDALNALIDRALIIQEFNKKGHSIPEGLIEEHLNEVIATEFGGSRATFIMTLQAQNLTLSQYREQVRDRIIVQAMRQRKMQQEVVVSPYKMEKYYQDNLEQFKVSEKIKLRMIFVKRGEPQPPPAPPKPAEPTESQDAVPASEDTAAETDTSAETETHTSPSEDTEAGSSASEDTTTETAAMEETEPVVETAEQVGAEPVQAPVPAQDDPRRGLAEEILAKLDEGESFESMARLYSEGREGKGGGDWGWIGRDVLRKELNEVAFSLKAGEHSRLVDTPEGYYILQVDDVQPEHTRALADVRDEIERTLLQQQRTKMQENWIKDLRAKAYIRLF